MTKFKNGHMMFRADIDNYMDHVAASLYDVF